MRSLPVETAQAIRVTDHPVDSAFIHVTHRDKKASLVLDGDWTNFTAASIELDLARLGKQLGSEPIAAVSGTIARLDSSGGFFLKRFLPKGVEPADLTGEQRELLAFLPLFSEYKAPSLDRPPMVVRAFEDVGQKTIAAVDFVYSIFVFIGRVSVSFLHSLRHPRRLRLPAIFRHIDESGIRALPIVGLLAVLISMVISYQGEVQLRKFGANIYTIDLTVVSLLREMGVLVTAIMIAGRSGSAFAAELGVMTAREEVNALKTMGLDPIQLLVVPRVIALVISLPLLTFLADLIGLVGGGLMSLSLLDISFAQYISRVQDVATPTMFLIGMIKAPVFAFVIAVISCYQGLNVSGSAESIGKMTTLSVVQSIFVVIMADALFSVVFSKAGI